MCWRDGRNSGDRSDASSTMLSVCKMKVRRLQAGRNVDFRVIDGSRVFEPGRYAMIASSFALQWFDDLPSTLVRLTGSLAPDGLLLFSVPIEGSFPEWEQSCRKLSVPFTCNFLPTRELFERAATSTGCRLDLKEEWLPRYYDSPLVFFKYMKGLGATTRLSSRSLKTGELRRLMHDWSQPKPGPITATYRILYGSMRQVIPRTTTSK